MNDPQVEWLIALWLTAVGSFIGSFLNVVVYRLPAGISIVTPRSRCPACKHPIRWFDNVPVLSWIVLRGRCRDCGADLARYPLVEAASAGMFLLLAVGEVFSGGSNLPLAWAPSVAQLLGIYAYHLVLLCTLLAAALMQYDGHRPPLRLFVPALVVGLAAPAIWPLLHPVAVLHTLTVAGPLAMIVDGLAGLTAGALLGRLAGGRRGDAGLNWSAACAGLFLGWQAACGLVAVTAAVFWLLRAAAPGPARRASSPGNRLVDPGHAGVDPRLGLACAMVLAGVKSLQQKTKPTGNLRVPLVRLPDRFCRSARLRNRKRATGPLARTWWKTH